MKKALQPVAALLLLAAVLFATWYFFLKPDKWSLFYYGSCLGCSEKWTIFIDHYDSVEECLETGPYLRRFQMEDEERDPILVDYYPWGDPKDDIQPTWECGRNCKVHDIINGVASYMCQETVDRSGEVRY